MSAPAAPAGWYVDPEGLPTMRWWDGATWTEQIAPMPPSDEQSGRHRVTEPSRVEAERVLAVGRIHSIVERLPLILGLTYAAFGVGAFFSDWRNGLGIIFSSAAIFGLWLLAGRSMRKRNTLTVSTRRVVGRTGVVHKQHFDTLLSKVEGITIERTMFGSLFGYGTVIVRGVGGSKIGFKYIANFDEFQSVLDQQVFARDGA